MQKDKHMKNEDKEAEDYETKAYNDGFDNPNSKDKCVICGGGLGGIHDRHNPMPVKEGECCSTCNAIVVIPARMGVIMGTKVTKHKGKDKEK